MTSWFDPVAAATLWERFRAHAFYQNGLTAGLAIALLCGVLSVFVVSRRMAFIGEGISHSAFGGAGLAYLVAVYWSGLKQPLLFDLAIMVFCVVVALAIGRLARRGRVSEDSAIGIALVAAMGLGVIFLDWRAQVTDEPRAALEDLLFGNLLSVTREEALLAWVVAVVLLGLVALFFKELLFFAFDSEGAAVFGVPAAALHYGLLVVLAITIVMAMRMMGVILASAFLVLPGTIGLTWSRRMGRTVAVSVAAAAGSLVAGLVVSMWTDFTVGPVIVLVLCAVLGMSQGARRLGHRAAA